MAEYWEIYEVGLDDGTKSPGRRGPRREAVLVTAQGLD